MYIFTTFSLFFTYVVEVAARVLDKLVGMGLNGLKYHVL